MRRLDMLATKLVGGGNITVTRESNADNIPPTAAPNGSLKNNITIYHNSVDIHAVMITHLCFLIN